jgi:hypothetical protein
MCNFKSQVFFLVLGGISLVFVKTLKNVKILLDNLFYIVDRLVN